MDEIRSKPFSETWDGTPNVGAVVSTPTENQITETTRPMDDTKFNALLATLGQRVAAITPPVAEAEPAAPTPQEQPPVALHELSADEFRAVAGGVWGQVFDAQQDHRPPPPLTVSQYLSSGE
jgi:hypothetical protein